MLACSQPDPKAEPVDTSESLPVPAHSATVPPGHSSVAAHSGSGHSAAPFDCASRPAGPLVGVPLAGSLSASEDFAFDREGHLISSDGLQLLKQEYPPGAATPFASTGSDPSSMRMLTDGDLTVANINTSSLYRVTLADGATSRITGGFGYATGIDVHRDGHVFIGDLNLVKRVDPVTGDVRVVFDLSDAGMSGIINGLSFGAAWDTLNIGLRDRVLQVPVDADGVPTGPPVERYVFDRAGELFGLGVDACDDVYGLYSGTLFRLAADGGDPETLWTGGRVTTNLQWGSGLGGWDDHAIYVVDRDPTNPPFTEIAVGVTEKPR